MSIRRARSRLTGTRGRTRKNTYCRHSRQAGRARATLSPVGSKGRKPRKPQHSQHLPKAGTKTDNARLRHEEHEAIGDTMGLGGATKGTRGTVYVVGAILLVAAIIAFVVLTVALS